MRIARTITDGIDAGVSFHQTTSIVQQGILAPDGVILIDDVHVHGPAREGATALLRKLAGKGELHYGKGKYSIPYLREQGFRMLFEGYQVVMGR
jgi:hypothetical protein